MVRNRRWILTFGILLMLYSSFLVSCNKFIIPDKKERINQKGNEVLSQTGEMTDSKDVAKGQEKADSINQEDEAKNQEIEESIGPKDETLKTEDSKIQKDETQKEELHIIDDNYRSYYEVFLASYYDSDGNGVGDIQGLIQKLNYINDNNEETDTDLGCNGIWLMPIMPSDTYHKYDVNDYYSVDPEYGTIEDFKELSAECKKRGIKLIIDLVFNHTSDTHPWFLSATSYLKSLDAKAEPSVKENKYFGYYNFAKDMENNSNYYRVGNTDWYYEGVFWSEMPDLNLANDEVRSEIEDIASYWLDLGVDGFRLDAAKEYFTGGAKKNIEVLSWFTNYVKEINADTYVVAEVWDSFGSIASYYESGVDSIFNYALGDATGKIATTVNSAGNGKAGSSFAKAMEQVDTTFRDRNPHFIDASFLSNHDNDRCAGYVGYDADKVKLLGGINLMMSGSSFIYYGEEIGMSGSGIDENKRAPMYWSETDSSGMTKGPAKMTVQEHKFQALEEQIKDENSIFYYYQKAVRLRNENPEIARGSVTAIPLPDKDIAAVIKTYEDSSIIILYNISGEEKEVQLDSIDYEYSRVKGYLTTNVLEIPKLSGTVLTMPPYSIVILK